jgi:hypothetical protein
MSRAMDNGVRANPLLTGFYGAQHLPQHLPQQPPLPQPPLPQPPLPQQPLPQQQLPQQPPLPHFTPPPLLTGFNAAQQPSVSSSGCSSSCRSRMNSPMESRKQPMKWRKQHCRGPS